MDNSREARKSSSTSMAASNGVTKRRQRFSESSRGQEVRDRAEKKERDPESVNRSKRRRSERFVRRNERDSSDESMGDDDDVKDRYQRKSLPFADGMIGVPVPRKARSACIKRSHDCRTSSGSGGGGFGEDRRGLPTSPGFEVASPSSSTVSVKQKKVNGAKSGIPKPPKSSGTMETEDDLEIEIAELLSGLKQQHPHRSKIQDESEIPLFISSEVKDLKTEGADDSSGGCKAEHSANIDKEKEVRPSVLDEQSQDSAASKGVLLEGPQLENYRDSKSSSNCCASKLEIDLMVTPTVPSSPERLSLLPLASHSIASKVCCKQDGSVKSKEKIVAEKRQCLNLGLESLSQEISRDSSLRLHNLDRSQPQLAKSAQQSSVLPLTVAVGGLPSGLPHQGIGRYVPLMQKGKPVDGESYTCVQGASFSASQPRPKRCATHFFISRNIQLHQQFVKSNHLPPPNKDSVYLKGGDLRPTAGNPSLGESPPILSLNSQAQDRFVVKTSESGHFASTRQKKPQPPSASSSVVPAQGFIFPTNHHLQPVILPSKSSRPTNNNPCVAVGTASVSFNHPSSSACEASSPYFTVLPNNAYSFQLTSTIRGGTPSQQLPFFNESFYSPQMFQPSQLLQNQTQGQRETKAASCSSSSHRQLQPQVSVNSVSSQANVQKHSQQSQKSEAKAAGDNSDSRGSHTHKGGPYGQIMTAPMQPQNFSMSFASFAGGSAPANLNFSTNGYQFVSAAPVVHHKKHQAGHQAGDSKTGGGSCSSHAEDQKKTLTGRTPAMNGQTLVFDNPSRTLNFVSGTWPPPPATRMSGDPSVFTHHLTQRQQLSGRSKTMTHSQADSVTAKSSQWKNPATSSLTSCNSLDLKQFQSQQQIRTHGQTQISFEAPSKSQQKRSGGGSSSAVTGSAPHEKAAKPKVNNSKALPLSPVPSSASHAQDPTENSASGSTQKSSPVCGRNVPAIITSCPGHLSELKY
ncbi:protein TIME FOR COFFEE isoform X1 [Brassica napus]|uniref:protein TIME FOR COFFEE isoform X1 n=1 Tax=Brassica napus TaxID=3708 RepID=UPI000BBEE207|nr:protein TIME FOR COFFEE isoform X1 [Brassica napus]